MVFPVASDGFGLEKTSQILQRVLAKTAGRRGAAYFSALARELATALDVHGCLITEEAPSSPPTRLATLAYWVDGRSVEPLVDRGDTPIETTVDHGTYRQRHLEQLFPGDRELQRRASENYAEAPMYGFDGEVIGYLAVFDTRALERARPDLALLQILATQAGAELERQRTGGELARRRELQRRMERKLLQSQRLETVGQLTGAVAHDFNNLLTSILGYGDLLLSQLPQDEGMHRCCEEIVVAARRAADLTRQLLTFSRRHAARPQKLELNQTLRDTAELIHRLVRQEATLKVRLGPGSIPVFLDPGELEQILLLLATNAREALIDGGEIILRSGTAKLEGDGSDERITGEYGWFSVSDTGVGIPAESRQQIFEPFFSTKKDHVGLGLSTVSSLVEQNAGVVRVESEVDAGTTFTVWFPRVTEAFAPDLPPRKPRHGVRQHRTILLVEDQGPVRRLVRRVLEAYGYDVLEAACASEALSRAAEQDGKIDLLITDIVMPGESGRDLALKLLAERPETRVIYMSGHTDEILRRHGIEPERRSFLPKPFSEKKLIALVRDILA